MYQDQDSIKLFQRLHERDRVVEMARHIGDNDRDNDFFLSHARAEANGNLLSNGIIAATFAVVAVLAWLYFR